MLQWHCKTSKLNAENHHSHDCNNSFALVTMVQLVKYLQNALLLMREYITHLLKIENSGIAKLSNLNCEKITEINKYDPNSLSITSGRKRGKYTICLSDSSSNPCKYIIGTFNENKNPSDMLAEVFEIPKPKRTQLNETVERLFFSPSLLID